MTDHIDRLDDGTLVRRPPAAFTPAEIAARARPHLRLTACYMDGCRCGNAHPAFADCEHCLGTGLTRGGDQLNPCARCSLRYGAISPETRALVEREDRAAREAAEDRTDAIAKERAIGRALEGWD